MSRVVEMSKESRPILLIEDACINALAFKKGMEINSVPNRLIHYKSMKEAVDFLEDPLNRPGLIIVGLSFAKVNGFDLLQHIQKNSELKDIPLIVLSDQPQNNITRDKDQEAVAGYYVRPIDYFELTELIGRSLN